MTYNEYLEQAAKLEAQANSLREQAEKAKAAEQDQFQKELDEARAAVISAMMNYLNVMDIAPETEDEYTALEKALISSMKDLENAVTRVKNFAKNAEVRYNGKKIENDDEKIKRFLEMLAEMN